MLIVIITRYDIWKKLGLNDSKESQKRETAVD